MPLPRTHRRTHDGCGGRVTPTHPTVHEVLAGRLSCERCGEHPTHQWATTLSYDSSADYSAPTEGSTMEDHIYVIRRSPSAHPGTVSSGLDATYLTKAAARHQFRLLATRPHLQGAVWLYRTPRHGADVAQCDALVQDSRRGDKFTLTWDLVALAPHTASNRLWAVRYICHETGDRNAVDTGVAYRTKGEAREAFDTAVARHEFDEVRLVWTYTAGEDWVECLLLVADPRWEAWKVEEVSVRQDPVQTNLHSSPEPATTEADPQSHAIALSMIDEALASHRREIDRLNKQPGSPAAATYEGWVAQLEASRKVLADPPSPRMIALLHQISEFADKLADLERELADRA